MRSDGLTKIELDEDESENESNPPITHQCVDCSAYSPPSRTLHTLISVKHGWRLSRISAADGTHRFEWRCPQCWAGFKAQHSTG